MVVAIIALVLAVGMPNVPGMLRSNKMSSAKNLIKTALAQAQSYAASHSKYAGIRFQKSANGKTYLVLIEHDPVFDYNTSPDGTRDIKSVKNPRRFVAIPGAKPKALPAGIGVLDGNSLSRYAMLADYDAGLLDYAKATVLPTGYNCIENYQTFSIVFSPTGQLVTKDVSVYPRYDSMLKTMVGLYNVGTVDNPAHNGSQYNEKASARTSYGSFDNVYPADSIFGSVLYANPARYQTVASFPLDSYLLNKPDSLLSYDAHFIPEINDYSYNSFEYETDPWCGDSTKFYYSSISNYYSCYYESSVTSFYLYMENEMNDASPDGSTRYSNFFSQSEGAAKDEGCEYFLLNMYTGDIFEE